MHQINTGKKNILVKVIVITALFVALPVSANVGKIVYGYGNNYAYDNDGNRRDLKKGSKIDEGDTLVTERGRMHVRLIDGGFISIYPNSEYKIEQFKFSGKAANNNTSSDEATSTENETVKEVAESKEDRGFFSLLKGAARQVTGLLGRKYNDNFKLKTTVATIGIRGTGFFARLCQADCFDADGNPMQDGMYIKNNIGVITMTTNAGDVALAQGQSAFAASSEDSPRQVLQPPIAHHIVTPDLELFDFDERIVDTRNDEASDLPGIISPPVDPPVAPPTVAVRHLAYISSPDNFFSEPLYALDTANANSSIQQNGDAIEAFTTVVPGEGPETVVFDMGTATLVESGRDDTFGVLWNRWEGTYTLDQNGNPVTSLDNNIHMIGSADLTATLPLSGIINYSGTGGTSPTYTDSVNGTLVGTQTVDVAIDYFGMNVTQLDITADFTVLTISASLANTSGNTIFGSDMNIMAMNATCTNCPGNGGVLSGDASVNIVGNNAEAVYGTYNLVSPFVGENAVSGSYFAIDTSIPPN